MHPQQAAMESLKAGIGNLTPRDREFAASLLDQFQRRGISEKQAKWIEILADRAAAKPAAAGPIIAADMAPIVALFAKAAGSLKRPAIIISSAEAGAIRLSIAGPSSSAPGSLAVTTAGPGGFEGRTYLGRIRLDGSWAASAHCRGDQAAAIVALLTALAADPAGVAAAYGKLTGACSFCARPLTDARSLAAGFGPVCAARYGLEAEWKAAAQ